MESFRATVLRIVCAIPRGKVTNYGTVALMAGKPGAARQVGGVLYGLKDSDGDVPWQRVVSVRGGISTYKVGTGELQGALLESEGVEVIDRSVDMRRYGWRPQLISEADANVDGDEHHDGGWGPPDRRPA